MSELPLHPESSQRAAAANTDSARHDDAAQNGVTGPAIANDAAADAPRPGWKRFLTSIALAVIAGAGAAGIWHITSLQNSVAQKTAEQEQTSAALAAAEQQTASTRLQLEQQLLDLQRQLHQLQQHQLEQAQQTQALRGQFDTRFTDLERTVLGRARSLQLDEAEALLRRAAALSKEESERDTALRIIERAGRQLEGLQDNGLMPILQTLKQEYDSLAAHPRLDVAALEAGLQGLSDQIPSLPLPTEMQKQIAIAQDPAVVPQNWQDWRAWLSLLGQELKGLVRVRNLEDGLRPQLMAEDRFLLDQQIRLRLEQARLALTQRDAEAWAKALRSAQNSLHDYYDLNAKAVEDVLMSLDALARTNFPDAAPAPDAALQALQQWRSAAH